MMLGDGLLWRRDLWRSMLIVVGERCRKLLLVAGWGDGSTWSLVVDAGGV